MRIQERAERALRWSEKYLKTDMVYLAKGGFWLSFGQILSTASNLVLLIAYANLLPKETYGTYKLVLSLAGTVAAFQLSGMGTAVTQAVARGFDGVLRTAFRTQLKWSLLMTLVAWGTAAYYFLHGNRTIAIALLIIGLLSPFIESASLSGDFLTGKKDFRAMAKYGAIRSLVPTVVLLATVVMTKNVLAIVLAYFLAHAVTAVGVYLRVIERYRPGGDVDHTSVTYGKHVSVTNALSIIAANLDKILVFHYLGAAQLAVYGIASSMPGQMKILQKMFSTLALPKLSSASIAEIRSDVVSKAWKVFAGFSVIVLAYVLLAPLLFHLFLPRYLDAVAYSQVYAIGFVFSPAILFSQTLFAHKKQREIYINKIAASAARIALLLVLLPLFGIWGAVAAFILTNVASTAISIVLFARMKE